MDFSTLLGGTGQTTSDFITWLKTWGATSNNYVDAWREVLIAKGYDSVSDDFNGMYRAWLFSQTGFSEADDMSIPDLENYAIKNGLYTFAPAVALYDGNRGVTVTGSGVSTWTDQINDYDSNQTTDSKRPTISDGVLTFADANSQELVGGSINTALNFTGAFTAVTLLKTGADFSSIGTGIIWSNGAVTGSQRGIALFFSSATVNKVGFRMRDGLTTNFFDIFSNDTLNDDSWHVIVITHDSSNNTIMYVDSTAQTDTSTEDRDVSSSTLPFIFGNETGLGTFYDGEIAQTMFFSDVLKSGEITSLTNNLLAKVL